MKLYSRIRHIFPYLYYRCYQCMYKFGGREAYPELDWNPELRAFLFVCAIKTMHILVFLLLPINIVFFNSPIVYIIAIFIGIILTLDVRKKKKYKEMMVLWKEETVSTRRKKLIFLVFFCMMPFLLTIPILLIFKQFSLVL